jgi:two-component system NtrC family sensor kinase
MQISITLLPKQFLTFIQSLAIAKWQYVYYTLVVFNLLTVSISLSFNHKSRESYAQSIAVNRQWAVRLESYAELGGLLAAVNAPGNDVFDSHNVWFESRRLASAQIQFDKKVTLIRQELKTQVNPEQAEPLLEDLDAVERATLQMIAEATLIFSYFRQQKPDMAGRRMATMDRTYQKVNQELTKFRRDVSQIQQQILSQQQVASDSFQQYEFAITAAMLMMVGGVTVYGHQLAQKMKSAAQEKEQSIEELLLAEARLQEQAQQLRLTLKNLQEAQLQLIQSEKMSSLGQLVAGVAHEINNPVNFIHGNLMHVQTYAEDLLKIVELYQKYYPNPVSEIQAEAEAIDLEFLQVDLFKTLTSMQIGTNRICEIVLSLRNFSRMDEAEFKLGDIHEGINSTLMILQHRLKAQDARPAIEVLRHYGELPQVECYLGQLNQVIMNLLTNAIDALEEGRTHLTAQEIKDSPCQITIRTSLIDSQWVEIAIADNGMGMPEEIKNRIFDPFFTTKPVGKGTGMGMSISYQIIVEKHGGKLQCFSTPNQGTEFVIQIPIKQDFSLFKSAQSQDS